MTEFRFTTDHKPGEVGNIIDVLRRPRLWIPTEKDYPDHDRWLEKTEAQIHSGDKRAMIAYIDRKPVGTIVYREHELMPSTVEIRNISVLPDARGRYVGRFLLHNVELEMKHDFPDTASIMVDTKVTNTNMITFLEYSGYGLYSITDLYGLGAGEDAVFVKNAAQPSNHGDTPAQ